MKKLTLIASTLLLTIAACTKDKHNCPPAPKPEEPRYDYVCTTNHLAFGRGTSKEDTLELKTATEIKKMCDSMYIMNDTTERTMSCALL